jgi:hypothetical protein
MPTPAPPANRPACDPEFPVPATPTLYYLRNKKRPITNYVEAEVTNLGHLKYMVQNEPKDGLGCPGTWLFEAAFTHFVQCRVQISGVRGSWTYGTNLTTVNQLTSNNQMALAEAAKQTWAYARASSKSFARVVVLDSSGAPGNYTSVDVVFLP